MLLRQTPATPAVKYILVPNQHVGCWAVSFMPQWLTREFLARRGGATFSREQVAPSRCPLLGWQPTAIAIEGRPLGSWFFQVEKQPEVGEAAFDAGAAILQQFFERELTQFLCGDLDDLGRQIIECCLQGGSAEDYQALIPFPTLAECAGGTPG